ncbi:hypothetical protein BJ508DRAFT_73556 [Ascobolus immersus RN42]|uniref:C2H2-type domain-containing protein n=1 Tax=Ascobolus immersus RN42 TaxID=1160509 RepID=A0A3N4HDY2_ASCIM|nr:hypothetical protein BJ508DRAFT_73556 [Ascobolus immersus RN42]
MPPKGLKCSRGCSPIFSTLQEREEHILKVHILADHYGKYAEFVDLPIFDYVIRVWRAHDGRRVDSLSCPVDKCAFNTKDARYLQDHVDEVHMKDGENDVIHISSINKVGAFPCKSITPESYSARKLTCTAKGFNFTLRRPPPEVCSGFGSRSRMVVEPPRRVFTTAATSTSEDGFETVSNPAMTKDAITSTSDDNMETPIIPTTTNDAATSTSDYAAGISTLDRGTSPGLEHEEIENPTGTKRKLEEDDVDAIESLRRRTKRQITEVMDSVSALDVDEVKLKEVEQRIASIRRLHALCLRTLKDVDEDRIEEEQPEIPRAVELPALRSSPADMAGLSGWLDVYKSD